PPPVCPTIALTRLLTPNTFVSIDVRMMNVSPDERNDRLSLMMFGAVFPPPLLFASAFHHRGGLFSSSVTQSFSFHFLSMLPTASESLYQTIHSPRTSRDPTLALNPDPWAPERICPISPQMAASSLFSPAAAG